MGTNYQHLAISLLAITLGFIILTSSNIIAEKKFCDTCVYKGFISKAIKDESGDFKDSAMDLGEFITLLDIEFCRLYSNDSIELKGSVGSNINNKMSGIKILYCESKEYESEGGIFKVNYTLCISDEHGNFSFKTKVSDDAFVIIVDRDDTTGIVYSLSSFKIE